MRIFRFVISILKFAVIFFVTIEVLFQIVGFQQNGTIYFLGSYPLVKTRSVNEWKALYDKLSIDKNNYFQYHPTFGWTHRPNSISQDSLMHFNAAGIRGSQEYSVEPSDSIVRIVLIGSSVMLSAEVADTNTLGYYLEKKLKEQGKRVEVLNMGVGSYGNDQTLLRWLYFAKAYQPDLVIQGVHLSECWMNLNIFKYCSYPPTGILFTKPRAVLENDSLKWVNLPAIEPNKIVDSIIIGFEKQPFFEYEYFRESPRYGSNILDNLYLYQIYHQFFKIENLKNIEANTEGQLLVKQLVNSLKISVEKANINYVMLQLVSYDDLKDFKWNSEIPNQVIWEKLIEDKKHLSTYEFLSKAPLDELFVAAKASHYSAYGNRLIAEQLAEYLMKKQLVVKKTME